MRIIALLCFISVVTAVRAQDNTLYDVYDLLSDAKPFYGDDRSVTHNGNKHIISFGDFTDEKQWELHLKGMREYFETGDPNVDVIIALRNNSHKHEIIKALEENNYLYRNFTFVFPPGKTRLVSALQYDTLSPLNTNMIMVLDENGAVLKYLDRYNCQGPKLKELEYVCYPEHFGNAAILQNDSLFVGATAPMALLGDTADWTTDATVVSFYPGAFTMTCATHVRDFSTLVKPAFALTLPDSLYTFYDINRNNPEQKNKNVLKKMAAGIFGATVVFFKTAFHAISNLFHAQETTAVRRNNNIDLNVVMISSSSKVMPQNWAGTKSNKSFKTISDTTGKISAGFGSLHKMKNGGYYSDRTVFVVDKKGVIRYVDYNYDVKKDFKKLQEEIKKAK